MEIINLQIGNTGTNLASSYFSYIKSYTSSLSLPLPHSLYDQAIPRTILIDLDQQNIDSKKLLFPELNQLNFISGPGRAGNWSAGHYTEGSEILPQVLESVRKNVEKCDFFQGFQVFHSAGGCTGGGVGTLVLEELKGEYYKNVFQTASVFYKAGIDDRVTEPYNVVFSMNKLIEFADFSLVISNESLFDRLFTQKILAPGFKEINEISGKALMYSLKPVVFKKDFLGTLRKFSAMTVPFPRMHFLDLAFSERYTENTENWFFECFDDRFSISERGEGTIMTAVGLFHLRGLKVLRSEIDEIVDKRFGKVLNNGFKKMDFDEIFEENCALVSNGTGCLKMFKRISKEFKVLFSRKAFIHWYTGEGLDSMEFECAEGNFIDLIEEYENRDLD